MSLARLSTELDAHIVEYCDFESQLALCSVSKYWRGLAEPDLYRNLRFKVDEYEQTELLLLTLLKRQDLARYIKSFHVTPSIISEHDSSKERMSKEAEQRERQRLVIYEKSWDLLPKMQQIIRTVWPSLHPELVTDSLLPQMGDATSISDHTLALILTLATNLEDLQMRVPISNGLHLVSILIHYYRTVAEVASRKSYPFCKLKNLVAWSAKYDRLSIWAEPVHRFSWIPMPVNAETYSLRGVNLTCIEYPVLKQNLYVPLLEFMLSVPSCTYITEIHPGFTPMLRVFELSECRTNTMDFLDMFGSVYFQNLEVLRLIKLDLSHTRWYGNGRMNWPNFGRLFSKSPPKLKNLQLSIWWDSPRFSWDIRDEHADLEESAGALNEILNLNHLTMDIGMLVHSFAEDACDELLELPVTVLPQYLEHFAITNVNLGFLGCVVHAYTAAEHRNVFGQLMTDLPHCHHFTVETYATPSNEAVETLKLIGVDLGKRGVELEL
ncbi:hypothetical protein PTMSG1_08794 [Pyrenophora teres f. maculata]|nr:hypothetical protein PTMSG1_08794 [Pyrenophora teres f. maculata]